MFPMVATLEEVLLARAALERAAQASRSAGLSVAREVHVGIMIEVPAAALMADALAPAVDFFSIGTNDLVQYTMAADRTSAELADLATPFQPAVLRLVERRLSSSAGAQPPGGRVRRGGCESAARAAAGRSWSHSSERRGAERGDRPPGPHAA